MNDNKYIEFACECGDFDCIRPVHVTTDEFEMVRELGCWLYAPDCPNVIREQSLGSIKIHSSRYLAVKEKELPCR